MVISSGITPSVLTDEDGEQWQRQLTTLVGWRQFVADVWEAPQLLSTRELKRLTAPGRDAYDDRRIDHHARLGVFETSDIRRVIIEGRRLGYLNRHADYGR